MDKEYIKSLKCSLFDEESAAKIIKALNCKTRRDILRLLEKGPKGIWEIAEALNVSVAEVYGVATFYAQFSLEPKGAYVIGVCTGTACYVKGAQAVLEKVESELNIPTGKTTKDGKFTIQATRCLGCCGLAPVMTINEDVYGRLKPEDIPGILAKYKA